MEYVFGTKGEMEVLKTKGSAHTNLSGYTQVERIYQGRETITDSFRVVRKLDSAKDQAGNCYDWYEIDRHYRTIDRTSRETEEAKRAAAAAGTAFAALAKELGVETLETGKFRTRDPAAAEAFRRRHEEQMNEEAEITLPAVDLSEFAETLQVSPDCLEALEGIVAFEKKGEKT